MCGDTWKASPPYKKMRRYYYSASIHDFLSTDENSILGELVQSNEFPTEPTQRDAWLFQIQFLKDSLHDRTGFVYFEYAIPRMGKRIDAVIVDQNVIFVLEFKVGQKLFLNADQDQVWDYALDLKNFQRPAIHMLSLQFSSPLWPRLWVRQRPLKKASTNYLLL